MHAYHKNHATHWRPGASPSGFTLIELLVVAGIIAILISIFIPALTAARRKADRARTEADLQAIQTGIAAFKLDNGDIPRNIGYELGDCGWAQRYGSGYGDGISLYLALMSPAPASYTTIPAWASGVQYHAGDIVAYSGSGVDTLWAAAWVDHVSSATNSPTSGQAIRYWHLTTHVEDNNNPGCYSPLQDGHDGFGFMKSTQGRVYGPYLQPGVVKVGGFCFVDRNGLVIQYFAAARHPNAINTLYGGNLPDGGLLGTSCHTGDGTPANPLYTTSSVDFNVGAGWNNYPGEGIWGDMIYNTYHAPLDESAPWYNSLCIMLGDFNMDGAIEPGETPTFTGPYFLWAAGPDKHYGLVPSGGRSYITVGDLQNCDDVMSFNFK